MSFDALAWAAKVRTKHSTDKLVLLGLAECADRETAEAFPSIAALCEFGSLNRKTVIASLDRLEAAALIHTTGEHRGRTGQVKVYALNIGKYPEIGTVKESQKRDRSQKRNSSDFTRKESQKRDTEPVKEPVSVEANASTLSAKPAPFVLPDWIPAEPWAGWIAMRTDKRAKPKGRAVELAIAKLERLQRDGHDPGAVLDQSTERSWTGLFPVKTESGNYGQPGTRKPDPVSPSLAFLRYADTLDDDPPTNGTGSTGYRAVGACM